MRGQRKQRGGTLVEVALILPVLLMFLMAVLEFGRAYNIYQVLTNAAREGARYAVAPLPGTNTRPSPDLVRAHVCSYIQSASILCSAAVCTEGGSQACVVVNPTSRNINNVSLDYTEVAASAPYSFILPSLLFGEGSSISGVTLRARAVMRNETN